MVRFSRAHVEALSAAQVRRFEDRCIELLRTTWHDRFGHLDDDAAREAVRERIRGAARHGFVGQRDVYRFVNLSCYLGLDFDRRPDLSWAVDLIRRPGVDLGETVEEIVRLHGGGAAPC